MHYNVIGVLFILDILLPMATTEPGSQQILRKDLHKVFVYGTLKKGEPNHFWFSKNAKGFYRYLTDAITKDKYPLIIATKYNIPFLLKSAGNGTNVRGELYEVDDKVLSDLDTLEDHPNFYIRKLYDIIPSYDQSVEFKAWIYMIETFKPNLLNETCFENYSSFGKHGKIYVERYLRDSCHNLKEEMRLSEN